MITGKEHIEAQNKAADMIRKAGIKITEEEVRKMDIVDLGLSNLHKEGVQVLPFFNTQRVAVRIIALFPNQTEPEHWHDAVEDDAGKEETIRVIEGTVYFYIPGEDNISHGFIPEGKEEYYTMKHEIVMKPCDQITLKPGTKHWFQAGKEGAVMYCISSCARDALDKFTDPNIVRATKIVD